VVPLAHLVDAVWTGSPPPRAKRQVQNRLSALRDRLGEASELIVADGPGYRTLVGDDQLDALRFQKPHSHISLSS
jgi:DNA-binding SARP family transcriptional activator